MKRRHPRSPAALVQPLAEPATAQPAPKRPEPQDAAQAVAQCLEIGAAFKLVPEVTLQSLPATLEAVIQQLIRRDAELTALAKKVDALREAVHALSSM